MVWNESTYDPLVAFCEDSRYRKNVTLKLWPKMLLTDQISVFFNRQYLANGLTSGSDFLHVEWMNECQGLLMGFLKKYLSWQTGHFEPKNDASS